MQKQDNLYAIFKLNQNKFKPFKQNANFTIKKQSFLLGRMALVLSKYLRQTMFELKPTLDNSFAVSTQDSPTNYASPRSAIVSSHTQEAQITKRRVDSQSPMLRRTIILKSTSMGHEPSTKNTANSNALHKSEKQKSTRIMKGIHRLNNLNTQNDTCITNEDIDYQAQFRSLNEGIYNFMTRYRTQKSKDDPDKDTSLVLMDDWGLTKWFSMGMGAALLFLAFIWMFMKIFVFVI